MINSAESSAGDPRMVAFNTARNALAGEVTRAFRGSSGSEKDIQEAQANLNAANSPEQLKAAVGQVVNLLGSKADSLRNQYKKAFGSNSEPNFLDPKAQQVLKKLGGATGADTSAFGVDGSSDSSAPAPAPSAPAGTPSLQDIMAELQRRGVGGG